MTDFHTHASGVTAPSTNAPSSKAPSTKAPSIESPSINTRLTGAVVAGRSGRRLEGSFGQRLVRARSRALLEFGDPGSPGELGRRARLARVLIWAAEGRLSELARAEGGPAPFGLLNVAGPERHWRRWRARAGAVFEEHLASGRDHLELDRLAEVLDGPRDAWPSPARLAAAAGLARPNSRALRTRAQALIHEGSLEAAARCLTGLLVPGASRVDRLVGCLGWASLYSRERRRGPARHALRTAVVDAPLAPEVWRLAHALAADLGDRAIRDQLARGARVVRRLGRAREVRSVPTRESADGPSAPPAAGIRGGRGARLLEVLRPDRLSRAGGVA